MSGWGRTLIDAGVAGMGQRVSRGRMGKRNNISDVNKENIQEKKRKMTDITAEVWK